MKKIFLAFMAAVLIFPAFAQTQSTRTMRVFHNGNVVYQRDALQVDSINFFVSNGNNSGGDGNGNLGGDSVGTVADTNNIYVGVVAFSTYVNQLALTPDVNTAKSFIKDQNSDETFTAFAYAVSKGNSMFDAEGLPEFDKIFMLNFSDGIDNGSSDLWLDEGIDTIPQDTTVYNIVAQELALRQGLNSYAMGFGDDKEYVAQMQKLLKGSGYYKKSESANDLHSTFQEIATSIIASAKNVILQTNSANYTKVPKELRLKFTASNGLTDSIDVQMYGNANIGFTLTISVPGKYVTFDAPAYGQRNNETRKVEIPLNNLKFVDENGKELQFTYEIKVKQMSGAYKVDVEDTSTAEEISKRIAVVLVLDCSYSMQEAKAFIPMQEAAVKFIETLEAMDAEINKEIGGHEYVDLGLPSGLLWATCNVGANNPEDYGDYFAWGETSTKYDYSSSTYYYISNPSTLPLSSDAANVNWGNNWRMPTQTEWDELRTQCSWQWKTNYNNTGCNGFIIQSTASGNSNYIFLPAAGYYRGSDIRYLNSIGNYWSASLYNGSLSGFAHSLYFSSSSTSTSGNGDSSYYNHYGRSVRPVCVK